VRILATSREPFGITGETAWGVPSLAVPDPDQLPTEPVALLQALIGYESVQLFVERAQAVQKTFSLTGSNARAVAQVCSQLEGIPLALELAAARINTMTVEQIVGHLDDRLGLLTGGSRAGLPHLSRQQTLRATLDWSYGLLSEAESSLLRRLSVFAGGWTLDTAEQVCGGENGQSGESIEEGQVLDLLTSLVDKSLVRFEERESAEGRYRLLEMVRQYAAESLQASGEADQIKTRHRDWFLALAEAAEPLLQGAEQADWLQRLEREHDNLRVALVRSEMQAQQGAQAGLRLAGALHRFWFVRGDFSEGRAYLARALEREGAAQAATLARAKALNAAGDLAYRQGDYALARALNEEGLTIYRASEDRGGAAVSLNHLGSVAYIQGDYAAARTLYEESLAIRRELGDRGGIAVSLNHLGLVAHSQGDLVTARVYFDESLANSRERGDQRGIAVSLIYLGNVAEDQGDRGAARPLYEESLAISRELGNKTGIASSLNDLGSVVCSQGDYDAARTLHEESLAIRRELGDKAGIAGSLYSLGSTAHRQGDYEAARTFLQESLALCRETGHSYTIHVLGLLGHVEREAGNYTQASAFYHESLLLRQDRGEMLNIARSLEDFAGLAGRQRQYERAVRLLGAAEASCQALGRTPPAGDAPEYERMVAAARAALGEEVFAAAWEAGRSMTLEQVVAYALKQDEPSSPPREDGEDDTIA
jgi:predicted ATPase